MHTYILGAGASHHVGYSLTACFWNDLADWMSTHKEDHFRELKKKIESEYSSKLDNVEALFTELAEMDQRHLRHAITARFYELRLQPATAYRYFADKCIQLGDTIINFNYDVSLERELKRAGKWEIGNGYGFDICPGSTPDSSIKLLKLHGSTNWSGDTQFNMTVAVSYRSGTLGSRPVVKSSEFEFLDYQNLCDPQCRDEDVTFERSVILPTLGKSRYIRFGDEELW